MERVSRRVFCLVFLILVVSLAPEAFARALFAYPLQGQTPQQQEADRKACADWAVQQTGYSPTGLPILVQPGSAVNVTGMIVPTPVGPGVNVATGPAGGIIGGVIGRKELAALDVLYANYLAAGATCLTARGYQVSM
jgi:hypothetical protein